MLIDYSWSLRQKPWAYFLLFLGTNCLMSYGDFPIQAKVFWVLFGLILPLYVALRTLPPPHNEKPGYLTDLPLSIPAWLWAAALLAVVLLRFYRLTSFPLWPNLDEGWIGTLAIELSKHWSWKFFYTFGETPPLTVWTVALLFKGGFSPAFSLWFPPALCSLLTVLAAYFAARRFFSPSFALLCGGLMGFSYWPLLMGRLCHQGIWLPLWVCGGLYLLGGFHQAKESAGKSLGALALGVGAGLGSFLFTPWPVVTGLLTLGLFWHWFIRARENRRDFIFYCLTLCLTLIPFGLAVLKEGFGSHIVSLTPWGGWFHRMNFLTGLLHYLGVLIWSAYEKDAAYSPVWGGFLNPLLGAFFWVGLVEMIRLRRLALIRWTAAAFLLFLLPGVLSPNLETFRIAQVLPLLLFVTALGVHTLGEFLPESKRLMALLGLLALTGAFDFNLLAAPYRDVNNHPENFGRPLKSLERYRAFEILKHRGLSVFLTDFDTNAFNDPTLSVMAYPLNGARNPAVAPKNCGQMAVFVNTHYRPFLAQRFPEAQWFDLSQGLHAENGGNLLGIFTDSPTQVKSPRQWVLAHEIFQEADLQRFAQGTGNFKPILQKLESAYPLVKGDPFLESVFWDKRGAFEYGNLDYDQHLLSYQMAVTRGYPTAELYYKLGQLLLVKQRFPEAQAAFLKASQAPLDLTQAKQTLESLKSLSPK
jgi:4-amino-4-deoxy-L-arabinose transferase-like glycosyltransferase